MTQMATITSKRQLTIPASIFKRAGFSEGDRVLIEETEEGLLIRSSLELVKELAGSVSIPKHLKNLDLDATIQLAKSRQFKVRNER